MKVRSIAIVLGSAPDALEAAKWELPDNANLVAINNAWQVRDDWDYLVHPDDFPADHLPKNVRLGQSVVTSQHYVPAQNRYGGFVYAGGTMAFTAGYWALDELRPDILAWFGCDMVYAAGKSHFYGKGEADPLRNDVTLQSLEAKSARLMALAARQDCACVNLSKQPTSRLLFPRYSIDDLSRKIRKPCINKLTADAALQAEVELGYMIEDGKYWKQMQRLDAKALARIDALWLKALQSG